MQGTSRSELAAELERCARLAEDTAGLYADRHGDRMRADVVSGLLLAAAAMDTAARATAEGPQIRATSQMIARTLVGDAIDAAERRGLDVLLLGCVASLRRVAERLDGELS